MRPLDASFVRSVLLPANLIVAALVIFGVLASTVEGDLRRVSTEIAPDLRRPPAGAPAGAVEPSKRGKLTVKVTRVRSSTGKVLVWLYSRGPFRDGGNIVARRSVPASPEGCTAVFEELPQAWYAVLAVHDENGNDDIDRKSLSGPPAEGIGTSNARAPVQGPPIYDDARFLLDREALEIEIPVFYY
jgi:uncharacterized protein (DUF2141 family)